MSPPPVILLHGFLRTGLAMLPMARMLRESGRRTRSPTFIYQTEGLAVASERLARLILELGVPVDLVTHSFGGLLARATLPKASIRRVVMLAPLQSKVKSLFNGKIIGIDVKHPKDYRKSFPNSQSQGLLIEHDEMYRLLHDGTKKEL